MNLVFALVAIAAIWFGLKWFANANPAQLANIISRAIGAGLMLLGAYMLARGEALIGPAVGAVGLGIFSSGKLSAWKTSLGQQFSGMFGGVTTASGAKGQSNVRSAYLAMKLDHASGAIDGEIIAGPMQGRALGTLSFAELMQLGGQLAQDAESRALLEAYLDRRFPRWREDMQANADAGMGRPANASTMSEQEAYEILGIPHGSGEAEIRAAYIRLIKAVHPDKGGSKLLAARINEARDRLL